jgi:hypothetical protein
MAMTGGTRSLHERLRGFEIRATVEQLALAASLYWLLLCNRPLFAAVFAGRDLGAASSWLLGISVAVLLLALHWLILLLVLNRWTARPLLALLFVITAFATFYIERFNIVLDSAMLRNVLQTHPAEARELLSPALLGHVLWQAGIPVLLLWRVRVIGLPPLRAGVRRLAALAIALVAAVAAAGAGGRRDRTRCQLGAERLRAPDHAATGRAQCHQLPRRVGLRHQHRGVGALHVRAGRPARLRRDPHPRQRVAAARAGTCRCRRSVARQPGGLQGRVRRAAHARGARWRAGRAMQRRPLPRRGAAGGA